MSLVDDVAFTVNKYHTRTVTLVYTVYSTRMYSMYHTVYHIFEHFLNGVPVYMYSTVQYIQCRLR